MRIGKEATQRRHYKMKDTDKLLIEIGELFATNPKEAERLYYEEYIPLIKKENSKMKKQLKEAF